MYEFLVLWKQEAGVQRLCHSVRFQAVEYRLRSGPRASARRIKYYEEQSLADAVLRDPLHKLFPTFPRSKGGRESWSQIRALRPL